MERSKAGDFSFPVRVAHVGANPVTVTVEADAAERAVLAAQWQVASVEAFSAVLYLARWKRDGIRMTGSVHAVISQSCVVTLEPVEQVIDEQVDQVFVPEGSRLARIRPDENGEIFLDPDGPDMPETFDGDTLDAGAAAAEFAALAIDLYPRKAGAEFMAQPETLAEEDKKPSPFAVLKVLKRENGAE